MSVTKQYRPWTTEQGFLFAPCPMEWLPEGHLAYFVLELVRELDMYCIGLFSSRKIERATWR